MRRVRGRGRLGPAHRLAHDRRPGDPAADGGRAHGRRRRRLDRLARRGRGAARRSALGGRRARSGLLRAAAATEPTVTDANLLLGYLPRGSALAGGVTARRRGRAGTRSPAWGESLGLDEVATAEGIVRVANQEMVRALRVCTVERGVDPREFALMPFGGRRADARGRHRRRARGCARFSARAPEGCSRPLACSASERRRDTARTVMLRGGELTAERIADEVEALRAGDRGRHARRHKRRRRTRCAIAARRSSWRSPARCDPDPDELAEAFAAEHESRYGYRDPDAEVELVTIRLALVEPGPEVVPAAAAGRARGGHPAALASAASG